MYFSDEGHENVFLDTFYGLHVFTIAGEKFRQQKILLVVLWFYELKVDVKVGNF